MIFVMVGRGGNVWLSPEGCAMFTLQLHIPLKSELGRLLSFLQHTVALAVVSSVCSLPGLDVSHVYCNIFPVLLPILSTQIISLVVWMSFARQEC